ncbi:MAG: sulfotransferase [Thermodesulfobacteriota bacterium]|nr:sulfotransferase [Thermodesulfobacteriota bacterium]
MPKLLLRAKRLYWYLLSDAPNRQAKKNLTLFAEAVFKKTERFLMKGDVELKHAPIFIVGPPRSGSTLLYQVIVRYFKICYFSNFMMRFPQSPASVAKFLALIDGCNPPNSFDSWYGETVGWRSPNQGFDIWCRWFPRNHTYVGSGFLSKEAINEIRSTIAIVQKSFKAPFLNKWQGNSARMLAIAEALPEALFIRIKRNLVFVAQSILQGKREWFEDDRHWFSTRPSNYEELKHKAALEQVCEQVISIEEDMDRDSSILGSDKIMTVYYEKLCKSPRGVMNSIGNFYMARNGTPLKPIHEIPSFFSCSNSMKVSSEELKAIETYFSNKKKIKRYEV